MNDALAPHVRFGSFDLDVRRAELRNGNGAISLQEQPFQILLMLVERNGEIVTREEIQKKLWPDDTVVEFDQSINAAIKKLRKALGDSADEPTYIRTVAKQGYRLLVPVERMTENGAAAESPAAGEATDTKTTTHSRWLWLGAGALVCVAIIVAWLSRPSQASHKLRKQDTIVIADFDNQTGDSVFDDTLRRALSIQMEQSPFLNVLSGDKLGGTLQLMQRQSGERLPENVAREVCLRSNSQAFLASTIARIGDRYLIQLRALNCQTGDTLASCEVEAANRDQVVSSLSKAANQLREKLGESLSSVQEFNQPLEQVTTSSLEALQAYTIGMKAANEKGPYAAIPYFKRAIEADPNFAIAYSALARSYGQMYDTTTEARYAAKAYDLRFRTSLRERFLIESTYWDLQEDYAHGVSTYTEWIQYFPSDYYPHFELATAYQGVGQWEKSATEAREAVRLLPTVDGYVRLMKSYLALNRLGDAHRLLREAEQHSIDGYLLRQERYQLAFLEKDAQAMREQNAWAAGKPLVEGVQDTLQSSVEAYYGRFAKARELMHAAETEFIRQQAHELADIAATIHAPSEVEIGRPDIAAKSINRAWASNPHKSDSIAPTVGLTLALLGNQAEARIVLDKLDKESPRGTLIQGYILPVVRAAGELKSNNPLQAVELLKAASAYELGTINLPPNALYPAYLRGLAYLKARQGQQAAAEFQKVIDHPGITLLHLQGALARLGLARAYALEAQTDPAYREKARTAYQNFLTLWKDADPDTPIYQQAKAEYAKLP